jgi:hypothetical protein
MLRVQKIMRLVVPLICLTLLSGCAVSLKQYGFQSESRPEDLYRSTYNEKSKEAIFDVFASCAFNARTHIGPFIIFPLPFIPLYQGWSLEREIDSTQLEFYAITQSKKETDKLKAIIHTGDGSVYPQSIKTKELSSCDQLDKLDHEKFELNYHFANKYHIQDICGPLKSGSNSKRYVTTFSYSQKCGDMDEVKLELFDSHSRVIFSKKLKKFTAWGVH